MYKVMTSGDCECRILDKKSMIETVMRDFSKKFQLGRDPERGWVFLCPDIVMYEEAIGEIGKYLEAVNFVTKLLADGYVRLSISILQSSGMYIEALNNFSKDTRSQDLYKCARLVLNDWATIFYDFGEPAPGSVMSEECALLELCNTLDIPSNSNDESRQSRFNRAMHQLRSVNVDEEIDSVARVRQIIDCVPFVYQAGFGHRFSTDLCPVVGSFLAGINTRDRSELALDLGQVLIQVRDIDFAKYYRELGAAKSNAKGSVLSHKRDQLDLGIAIERVSRWVEYFLKRMPKRSVLI